MKEVVLSNGLPALVDDEDFERITKMKWHFRKGCATSYAQAHVYREGKRTTVSMHQLILDPDRKFKDFEIDHINGNGLDNRRENLRLATVAQNQANRGKPSGAYSSKYKGVSQNGRGRWRASIFVGGKTIRVGDFDTPERARDAYAEAAKKYFGEFAKS